jgi:hypothetical protein
MVKSSAERSGRGIVIHSFRGRQFAHRLIHISFLLFVGSQPCHSQADSRPGAPPSRRKYDPVSPVFSWRVESQYQADASISAPVSAKAMSADAAAIWAARALSSNDDYGLDLYDFVGSADVDGVLRSLSREREQRGDIHRMLLNVMRPCHVEAITQVLCSDARLAPFGLEALDRLTRLSHSIDTAVVAALLKFGGCGAKEPSSIAADDIVQLSEMFPIWSREPWFRASAFVGWLSRTVDRRITEPEARMRATRALLKAANACDLIEPQFDPLCFALRARLSLRDPSFDPVKSGAAPTQVLALNALRGKASHEFWRQVTIDGFCFSTAAQIDASRFVNAVCEVIDGGDRSAHERLCSLFELLTAEAPLLNTAINRDIADQILDRAIKSQSLCGALTMRLVRGMPGPLRKNELRAAVAKFNRRVCDEVESLDSEGLLDLVVTAEVNEFDVRDVINKYRTDENLKLASIAECASVFLSPEFDSRATIEALIVREPQYAEMESSALSACADEGIGREVLKAATVSASTSIDRRRTLIAALAARQGVPVPTSLSILSTDRAGVFIAATTSQEAAEWLIADVSKIGREIPPALWGSRVVGLREALVACAASLGDVRARIEFGRLLHDGRRVATDATTAEYATLGWDPRVLAWWVEAAAWNVNLIQRSGGDIFSSSFGIDVDSIVLGFAGETPRDHIARQLSMASEWRMSVMDGRFHPVAE